MSLVCPVCDVSGLESPAGIELPAPDIWQELHLQVLACPHCGFCGAGVYLESRAGRLDSEIVHHLAYRVEAEELADIQRQIESCPEPLSKRCDCSAHVALLADYEYGKPGRLVGFRGEPHPMLIPYRP